MKKTVCCLAFFITIYPAIAQTIPETVDELLKVYARQYVFNGVVLLAQKDNILLQKGYGYKNVASHVLNNEKTIFQIGSITKQFTAVIILQLQEKHLLSVYDKINKYIPDYPHGDQITIENLLTHTSGIFNYTNDEDFMKTEAVKPISREKLIDVFKNRPLDFQPGEKYNYSNSGYILLGYIVEKITGKSYFTVVRENIFQPLHMDHSGFDYKSLKSPNKATGYLKMSAKTSQPSRIVDSSVSFAAGGIYTTAGDLFTWNRALYTDQLVHGYSLQQAFTPHLAHYGYGWIIDSTYGKKVLMHEGGIFGFTSFISRIPEDEICIILLDNHTSPGLAKMAEDINAIVNNQPYDFPRLRDEIELDTSILNQYVGSYELGQDFIMDIFVDDGQLMAQVPGQAKIGLFAEKKDFFFTKIVDTQIEFSRDADGKVTWLTLNQGGQEVHAKKIK